MNTHSTSLRSWTTSRFKQQQRFLPTQIPVIFFFSSCNPLGLCSRVLEWQTMRPRAEQWGGPQRALSPQHRCILAQWLLGVGTRGRWGGGFSHLSLDSVVNLAFILWTCFLPAGGWSCLCLGSCWFQHHVCGRKALGSVRSMRGRAAAWLIPHSV